MADTAELLVPPKDEMNVAKRLDLTFNDATEPYGLVRPPSPEDAKVILDFFADCTSPHFVAQCQAGVGRSQAVVAALAKVRGGVSAKIIANGSYNIRLYDLILQAAGLPLPSRPLVTIAVRVKYGPERLQAFLLSMRRQRYTNWKVVAVTDGPNNEARSVVEAFGDERVQFIETKEPRGLWGHPYRQLGIDAALDPTARHGQEYWSLALIQPSEFIGLSNDDNYYTPGYLEQMIGALQTHDADLAACKMLHSYFGWEVTEAFGYDLGAWIARRELVAKVPWPGVDFDADSQHFLRLCEVARKIVTISRPLFVHN